MDQLPPASLDFLSMHALWHACVAVDVSVNWRFVVQHMLLFQHESILERRKDGRSQWALYHSSVL